MADESVCIGGHENYLSIETLINVAKKMNCDAIHPGMRTKLNYIFTNPIFFSVLIK